MNDISVPDLAAGEGVFPDFYIARLLDTGAIKASQPLETGQIQPASLDLRLGATAYRLRASFLPGAKARVADRLAAVKLHEVDLSQGAVLETGCVYLAPLLESLALPADISAAANPKSSTGRLDVFTRIIADGGQEFDKIPPGYNGPLYLEISPRSFPVLVRRGSRLAQMRFHRGQKNLDGAALRALQEKVGLVADAKPDIKENGLALSVDLCGADFGGARGLGSCESAGGKPARLIGYRAKSYSGVVDVDKKAAAAVEDFWEPIYDSGKQSLILDPNAFYILASREAVYVPPLYAAEMTPFDPLVGEFRVHYAGFFDPGFGAAAAGGDKAGEGARAVLEVRSLSVPFILEHGQIIGRLLYEPMLAAPRQLYGAGLHSHYQAQKLQLSKHFKTG